jgi:hypothetical protein
MEHGGRRSSAVVTRFATPGLRLRISNRQWLARLENAVTRGKQTPEANSNRHIRDACSVQTPASISPRRRFSPFSIFTFPSSVAARRSSAISNRERLARLETMPNPLKIKAGHDF